MSHKIKPVTDLRASRSRRALLDAAIELLLINPGASLSDIAQHAGVGRATLYRHFESRVALIRELALESLETTDAILQPIRDADLSARETLEQGLIAIMQVADRFHFLLILWQCGDDDPELEAIYNRQLDNVYQLVERGKQEKSITPELSSDWIVMVIDSLVYAGWWAVQSGDLTAEQAGRHATQSLFNGIASE